MAKATKFYSTNFTGRESPYGFGFEMSVEEDKTICGTVVFDEHKQGAPGLLHGGASAAVLDEAMGAAVFEYGKAGFTASMTINYHKPIPLFQEVTIRAWVEKSEGKKIFTACEARLEDGTVAISGTGLFIQSEMLQALLKASFTEQENEK
jgi:acyl-coenzyme A thioesterase PaaI-like protein